MLTCVTNALAYYWEIRTAYILYILYDWILSLKMLLSFAFHRQHLFDLMSKESENFVSSKVSHRVFDNYQMTGSITLLLIFFCLQQIFFVAK